MAPAAMRGAAFAISPSTQSVRCRIRAFPGCKAHRPRLARRQRALAASTPTPPDSPVPSQSTPPDPSSPLKSTGAPSVVSKVKEWWRSARKIDRSTLAALGTSALLSYGAVSNFSYILCVHIATGTVMSKTGQGPLATKETLTMFTGVYIGLWVLQNFLRPARFALSVVIAPFFNNLVQFIKDSFKLKRTALAFAVVVFFVNVLGTFAWLFGGYIFNSLFFNVPLEFTSIGDIFQAAKAARASPESAPPPPAT